MEYRSWTWEFFTNIESVEILELSFGLKKVFEKSFLQKNSLLQVDLDIEYTKLNVGQVVDSMTRGSCIPTDLVKSDDNHPNLIHNIGVGAYTDSDKTNPAYLVG